MVGVDIYHNTKKNPGWVPILHMIQLAARLFDGRLLDMQATRATAAQQLRLKLVRAPRHGVDVALCIARSPAEIERMLKSQAVLAPYRCRVLWIIDSFRTQHLPGKGRMSNFDVIAYTQGYDGPHYEALYGDRALFLGWGTDALDLGTCRADRRFDILRIGRQPDAWDDDDVTARACRERGLTFHGRPPIPEDLGQQQPGLLRDWYGQTKFVIAHSNLVAPASYTHKTKEYITARWTDALAAGAVVAGAQPRRDLDLLDWPGAVLDFDRIDLAENLDRLTEARAAWTPRIASENHAGALQRLDWRWRFHALAARIGLRAAPLEAEIIRLRKRIETVRRDIALAKENP